MPSRNPTHLGANSYTGSLLLELMVKLMALRQRKKNNFNTNSDTSQGGHVSLNKARKQWRSKSKKDGVIVLPQNASKHVEGSLGSHSPLKNSMLIHGYFIMMT